MKRRPIKGEVLYLLTREARSSALKPVTVVRVGTKFFYCSESGVEDYSTTKFHLSSWGTVGSYPERQLFETEQAYHDEVDARNIANSIAARFGHFELRQSPIPLEDLRKIKEILKL